MIGQTISHYKILEKLGEGGMGVVYKAQDTKLDRTVAIKFLPRQISASAQERQRFSTEAKAAAALNHPNIATIHAIEEADDETFIVMEYVEGNELKEKIAQRPLSIDETINIAIQIAEGLHAAHKKEIVHRDIKSANIMLTESGQVKIMDFGLAKVRGGAQVTKVGTTVGTAAYMSPEQARGDELDHRTDIWSFGVVLYEMLAGRLPFKSDYEQAVIYAILNEEPETLVKTRPDTAGHFQPIIEKALAKDRDERYQSMSDVLTDLRRPAPEVGHESSRSGTMNDRPKIPPLKRRRKIPFIGLGMVVGLVLLAVVLWKEGFLSQKDARPFQNMQIARLTSTGKAGFANISPDGNYVVHALHDKAKSSLWVRQVATGSNVQIVLPADVAFEGTTFSPDGNYICYVMSDKATLVSTLYRIPTLGGNPKKILSNLAGSATLSPDGQQIAFVRQFSSQGEEALMLANVDGSDVRKLASRKEPEFFVTNDHVGPSWSPDGRWIACGAGSVAGEWRMGVLLVSVEDGRQEWLLKPKKRFDMGQVVWTPDGKGLVFNAIDTTSQSRYQLWHVTYPASELHRVTNDLNSYETASLGVTADGRMLVTVKVERTSNIWTIPDLDASRAVQLSFTAGTDEGTEGVSIAADGRIVYSSVESGNPDIWIMDQDGKSKQRLTSDTDPDYWPSLTPDGRTLVFESNRTGIPHIWKMDLESGDLVQLTEREDYDPVCTWDGQWVVYWGYRPGRPDLYGAPAYSVQRVAIDGGTPVQLTEKLARTPAVSPDGKYFACRYQDVPGGPLLLAILPFNGGQPLKLFKIPPSVERFVWTADGSAVMYVDTRTGVSNIWSQPIAGGPPKKLTNFKSGVIFNFAISRDGRTIVCARGSLSSDVVLIKDFR